MFHKLGHLIHKLVHWISGTASQVQQIASNPSVMMLPGAINATADLYKKLKGDGNTSSSQTDTNYTTGNKVFIEDEEAIGKIIEFLEKLSNSAERNNSEIKQLQETTNNILDANKTTAETINLILKKNEHLNSELILVQKKNQELEIKSNDLNNLLNTQKEDFENKVNVITNKLRNIKRANYFIIGTIIVILSLIAYFWINNIGNLL